MISGCKGLTWLLCVGQAAGACRLDSGWKPPRPDLGGGRALRVGGAAAPTHATAGGVAGGRARLAARLPAGLPPSIPPGGDQLVCAPLTWAGARHGEWQPPGRHPESGEESAREPAEGARGSPGPVRVWPSRGQGRAGVERRATRCGPGKARAGWSPPSESWGRAPCSRQVPGCFWRGRGHPQAARCRARAPDECVCLRSGRVRPEGGGDCGPPGPQEGHALSGS